MVGISLLTLVPGVVGGSETYARELTRSLAAVGELEYRVYLPSVAPDAHGGLPSRVVSAYRASCTIPGRIRAMVGAALYPRSIRNQLLTDPLKAIHFPLTVMLPPVDKPPAVTTILDVAHALLPSAFSPAERAYRKLVYGWTAGKSRLVIAISEHVRATLIEHLGLPAERVRVIHLGVDHERFRPAPTEREPFFLYPANGWQHKNHTRLIQAFSLARREHPELKLVLTGTGLERFTGIEGVEVRGRVRRDELVSLYQRASGLVVPSLYEGFGLPALEAMACGCPVAAARVGALPEVCGDAAVYFEPTAIEDIASAISGVLSRGEELSVKGIARASSFSWNACARKHESVFRELIGG